MEDTNISEENRADHLWKPGESGNPNGRPPMTEAQRLEAKAKRDFVKEYKEALRDALPLISPVLIAKAMEGDMAAIKEVNDRVMGKAPQQTDITTNGKELPTPIMNLHGILSNNSNEQNSETI